MSQSRALVDALKRCLKSRGMSYRRLGEELGLSEPTIKRQFSRGDFTLARLERICGAVGIDFYELARMSRGGTDESDTLSDSQEQALARDPKLFTCFYLLLSGLSASRILRDYRYEEPELTRSLVQLDRLRLIELLPGNRVKLLTRRNVRWMRDGKLSRRYESEIKREFLEADFNGPFERARLLTGYVSKSSLKALSGKIDKLIGEFLELSDTDEAVSAESGEKIWMLVAYRPWVFSVVSRLRRSP